jgi:hypothetical protein
LLPSVSAILCASDAEDLRWYWGSGGISAFDRSPLAGMLARAELYGRVARPCRHCGGDTTKWEGGSGFVDSRTGSAPEAATAKQLEYAALIGIDLSSVPAPLGDRVCDKCGGRGWVATGNAPRGSGVVTARPTGSSIKHEGGVEMDIGDMARMGRVSARLSALRGRSSSVPAAHALEAYYSPDGGSLGALWHLTPAGTKMLRTNPQRLPPTQFFANEREAQVTAPKPNRKALFDAAEQQAKVLFEASCRLWNETRPSRQRSRAEVGQ